MIRVTWVCDRCGIEKVIDYTDRPYLGGGFNVTVAGIEYWLCEDCEVSLNQWLGQFYYADMGVNDGAGL